MNSNRLRGRIQRKPPETVLAFPPLPESASRRSVLVERPGLSGEWFIDGQPTQFEQDGATLRLINEFGGESAGRFLNTTHVEADDWGDLVGTIDGNGILWENGSAWLRPPADVPELSGLWSIDGQPTEVQPSGPWLTFINERNEAARGGFLNGDEVVAESWGNLMGARIDEVGDESTGRTRNSHEMEALDWGRLTGKLSSDQSHIDWANGSVWERAESTSAVDTVFADFLDGVLIQLKTAICDAITSQSNGHWSSGIRCSRGSQKGSISGCSQDSTQAEAGRE